MKGWVTKKLDELTEADSPITYGVVKPGDPGDMLFIRGGDLVGGRILDNQLRTITSAVSEQYQRTLLRGGELLICLVGQPGQVAVAPPILAGANIARQVGLIRLRASIDAEFISYFLQSPDGKASLGTYTGGSVQQVINLSDLRTVNVPVPPLAEQQRIVGLLDEAFEGLATAKANTEKNLQNARALFESHLQAVFTQRGVNWDNETLETLLERGWIESHLDGNHGSDYPRKEEFVQEGIPYISANCLDDDDRIDMSRAKYLSPARAALLRKGIAKNNDVLFAHNATVGPVAILQTDEEKVILGTSLTYYRCNTKHILPEYLAHYMRSFGFKKQYLQIMGQSTRNQVPITKQREFVHVIPPLEEQKRIIVALDGLLENGQRLTSLYERKLAALEALKKALLHQAFAGEL